MAVCMLGKRGTFCLAAGQLKAILIIMVRECERAKANQWAGGRHKTSFQDRTNRIFFLISCLLEEWTKEEIVLKT